VALRWGNLDEIKPGFFRNGERFVDGNLAAILASGIDELNAGTRMSWLERGPSFVGAAALNGLRMATVSLSR
jgi:hypothetical protein